MNKKVNIDNLFVVSPVAINDILIEPFIQYETFGKEFHQVIIDPKKILVLNDQKNDTGIYQEPFTGEEVNPVYYPFSYETRSSVAGTLYHFDMILIRKRMESLALTYEKTVKRFIERNNMLGYVMPFKEYFKNIFGFELKCNTLTLSQAKAIVSSTNLESPDLFALSDDVEEAKKQIDEKVFRRTKKRG